jgi:hypothetical protein
VPRTNPVGSGGGRYPAPFEAEPDTAGRSPTPPYSTSAAGKVYLLPVSTSCSVTARRISVRRTSSFGCRSARAATIAVLERGAAVAEQGHDVGRDPGDDDVEVRGGPTLRRHAGPRCRCDGRQVEARIAPGKDALGAPGRDGACCYLRCSSRNARTRSAASSPAASL